MDEPAADAQPSDEDRFSAIRRALEAEQEQLANQVEDLDHVENDALSFDENLSDRGTVAAEQGENKALAARLREQLDDVALALARLEDGSYGTCVQCGTEIADARLEAMPAARFCIDCAS